MPSARTILRYLKKHSEYLNNFCQSDRSIYFEDLIGQAFSHILYLPYYTRNDNDTNISFRVTWQGDINHPCSAPPGPDTIACCYDFNLLIEATLKTGANQWTQEFASSARHCEDFINQNRIQSRDVYIILVTPKLHRDTYRSIHQHPEQKFNFVLVEVSTIAKILETSILAFTMRHLDLREIFDKFRKCIKESPSLDNYYKSSEELLTEWQESILKREKYVFIGIKSYKAMRIIEKESRRKSMVANEIFKKLQNHPFVTQYLKIAHDKLLGETIENSILQGGFAREAGHIISSDEKIFEPVSYEDFKGRELRLIKEVERISV